MLLKKVCFVFLLLMIPALSVSSQADSVESVLERSLMSFGFLLSTGEAFDSLGTGLIIGETHVFLSGNSKNGVYLLLFFSGPFRLTHANDIEIDDMKILGIGYRGESFIHNLGFEASLALTAGNRRIEDTIYGDIYCGISPELGLYYPHNCSFDIGIYVNPNFHLFKYDSLEVGNKSYYDISLKLTLKELIEKTKKDWND